MFAKHEAHYYQIIVQGHLDDRWINRFEGLRIECCRSGVTKISGEIVDQSALYGILNHLNDIGLELISLQRKTKKSDDEDD